eukprot:TRINITY_DN12131_c0_g1_i5.p1 TRINITY_DN12131_c0_g1~~TRINITY_DN12131_c0_g1_i5.p1  ORF type:complete len:1034 (+),score=110.03 TRINITY_DN12131_c0_g1_i5:105-3206(+)
MITTTKDGNFIFMKQTRTMTKTDRSKITMAQIELKLYYRYYRIRSQITIAQIELKLYYRYYRIRTTRTDLLQNNQLFNLEELIKLALTIWYGKQTAFQNYSKKNQSIEILVQREAQVSVCAIVNVSEFQNFDEIWLKDGQNRVADALEKVNQPAGDIQDARAHWVLPEIILIQKQQYQKVNNKTTTASLFGSTEGGLKLSDLTQISDNSVCCYELSYIEQNEVPDKVWKKFPHLRGFPAFKFKHVNPNHLDIIDKLIKTQLVIKHEDLRATGVQIQGVLDELYAYQGSLGYNHKDSNIRVWAPTATNVEWIWWGQDAQTSIPQSPPVKVPMNLVEGHKGVWEINNIPKELYGTYYKFQVTAYNPWTQCMHTTQVTDPYSRFLTPNGEQTVILDINDDDSKPFEWEEHNIPKNIQHPTDISIYELHIRDFSATDETVQPPEIRGKYRAFNPKFNKFGMGIEHLKKLREAGITHIHLLPSYDFGSAPERASEQLSPPDDLGTYPPDSEYQQQEILKVADRDAYQWGYDPVHYGVPEGSYATNPHGIFRVKEYREMVQSLHEMGFQVVLDLVYNHTYASGTHKFSVLDKIVPGYYHRREADGQLCHSTCCNNTATEHLMCERLIIDDVTHWAQNYKIDGFRFDIMGHLMLSTMEKIKSLLPEAYLYGEGWDFGEVRGNLRGRNASQLNLSGTGIGTFNDRIRDAALGGGPFDTLDLQGFLTGLYYEPNANPEQGDLNQQKQQLLDQKRLIKVGLTGNIREYPMKTGENGTKLSKQIMYHGHPAGYCDLPQECVNYISCHDNYTLFDNLILKAKFECPIEQRVIRIRAGLALLCVSQGVPFFHAGDDLLRSKSLDRDSYNSGDWFNKIDWSGQSNNFGVGLPVATKNKSQWHIMKPLLARQDLKPSSELIIETAQYFQTMLKVRYSSPLFRLRTAKQVCEQVEFADNDAAGVIVMKLNGNGEIRDANFENVFVVINMSSEQENLEVKGRCVVHPTLENFYSTCQTMKACEVHQISQDITVLKVPQLTVAVFVQPRIV